MKEERVESWMFSLVVHTPIVEDKGKGRWLLKNDEGGILKKSYNTQRLKLWLPPNEVKGSILYFRLHWSD